MENIDHLDDNNIDTFNDISETRDINNINNNNGELIYQNNNSLTQQKLINDIEDINERFIDLDIFEIENKNLKKELLIEKKKNRKIPPNNIKIYENSINQGKILLEDVKKKNAKLREIIDDLESKNKSLNYQLIEVNQKLKKYENDSEQKNITDNKNESNGKNDKESSEITKLENKIDEYEILISKMKFDKKTLEDKIENLIKEHKLKKI